MAVIPVFVSSTFRDFHSERDLLAGVVRERLDEQLKNLGCRVEIIDLRWGVDTEGIDDAAAARRVVDVCLQQVARARPLFVGLIGERVGYTPAPEHARWVADNAKVPPTQPVKDLSVTELEFGFGMLWPSAPPGEHIVLFRDLDGPAPIGWIDVDRKRIAAFRARVSARVEELGAWSIHYSTTVDQNTQTVRLDQVTTGGSHTSFENLLVDALARPVRRRAEQVITDSGTGWQGAERLFRDDHRVAVGRDHLISDVTTTVASGGRVVLLGDSGTGKSTLVCSIEARLRSTKGVAVISVLLGTGPIGASGRDAILQLVAQLRPVVGLDLEPPSKADDDQFILWWGDVLTEAATRIDGRLVLIVDALDALSDDRARTEVWPASVAPPAVAVLCSTASPDQASVLTNARIKRIDVARLSAKSAADAAQAWAAQTGRSLPGSVVEIVGSAPRAPLWVRLAVNLLSDLDGDDFAMIAHADDQAAAITQRLLTEVRALPSATTDLAGEFLHRVAERIGDDPAALLLGTLASARSGLAPADLALVLHGDPDAAHKVAVLQRVLGDQLVTTDASGRLTFAHASVRACAVDRAAPDTHHRLTAVFAADETWDNTDALDTIWHTICASAEDNELPTDHRNLARYFTRAANYRPAGSELTLMSALDLYPETGIQLIGSLAATDLTTAGLELLLSASQSVDRRLVSPNARVNLCRAILTIARSTTDDAATRHVSWALSNLGRDSQLTGDLKTARRTHEEALHLIRHRAQTLPRNVEARRDLAVGLDNLGGDAETRGDLDTAAHAYRQSLELARDLAQRYTDSTQATQGLIVSLGNAGRIASALHNYDTARQLYEEQLGLARNLARTRRGNIRAIHALCASLNNCGSLAERGEDLRTAQRFYQESLDHCRNLSEKQPGNVQASRNLSISLLHFGDVAVRLTEFNTARRAYKEALDLARNLVAIQPGNVQVRKDLAVCLRKSGYIAELSHDSYTSYYFYKESLDVTRHLFQIQNSSLKALRDLIVALNSLGRIAQSRREFDTARKAHLEAHEYLRDLNQKQPGSTQTLRDLVSTLNSLGDIAKNRSELDTAKQFYAEALELTRTLVEMQPDNTQSRRDLAAALDKVRSVKPLVTKFAPRNTPTHGCDSEPDYPPVQPDKDHRYDVKFFDTDPDGHWEMPTTVEVIHLNEDGTADTVLADTDGDGMFDHWDTDGDGACDVALIDDDGVFDYSVIDTDTDITYAHPAALVDEDVQFTAYRPTAIQPQEWNDLLIFAHRTELPPDESGPNPIERVQVIAESLLGESAKNYDALRQDSAGAIPKGGELTIIPSSDHLNFSPTSRSFRWSNTVHLEQFRFQTRGPAVRPTVRGSVNIYLGPVLLASLNFAIRIDSSTTLERDAKPVQNTQDNFTRYRKIFVSYSHRDTSIVTAIQKLQLSGDTFLRDVDILRPGEIWDNRLQEMINESDVFQLFWSSNSMRSEFVRKEWEYALSLGRREFIRPVYWERPLPELREKNLPPAQLKRLHFQPITIDVPPWPASAGQSMLRPSGSAPTPWPSAAPGSAPISGPVARYERTAEPLADWEQELLISTERFAGYLQTTGYEMPVHSEHAAPLQHGYTEPDKEVRPAGARVEKSGVNRRTLVVASMIFALILICAGLTVWLI